jgi:phosphoribosyl 1,2-cyclic phosphodiesterase
MSSNPSAFSLRLRYWGVTGTLPRTALPETVAAKIAEAVDTLLATGLLKDWVNERPDRATIERTLEAELPFHLRSTYYGNTTCIEIETPGELIVVDGGSGFRDLGYDLERRWADPKYAGPRRVDVVFTHPHLDHIFGLPYVESLYNPQNHFAFWAPQSVLEALEAALGPKSPLTRIYSPTNYADMAAIKEFHAIRNGEEFCLGETRVRTHSLNHPGGSLAYRFDHPGERGVSTPRSIVIATDHEHQEIPDRALGDFARDADLLYADAQYRREEYTGQSGIGGSAPHSHVGWGHSTLDAVIATAVHARVRTLHIGHHEPHRMDAELSAIEELAVRLLADQLSVAGKSSDACQMQLAYEGLSLQL